MNSFISNIYIKQDSEIQIPYLTSVTDTLRTSVLALIRQQITHLTNWSFTSNKTLYEYMCSDYFRSYSSNKNKRTMVIAPF